MHTYAKLPCRPKLGADKVSPPCRKNIMMVKAGGAAVFHQLSHACKGGKPYHVCIQILPYFIKILQPVKQLKALHLRKVAGKLLIKVMMGIHKTGIAYEVGSVYYLIRINLQFFAYFLYKAILAVYVRPGKYPVLIIAGYKGAYVFNKKLCHTVSSEKFFILALRLRCIPP